MKMLICCKCQRGFDSYLKGGVIANKPYCDRCLCNTIGVVVPLGEITGRAILVLDKIEWIQLPHDNKYYCPDCKTEKSEGHHDDCDLNKVIEEYRKEKRHGPS